MVSVWLYVFGSVFLVSLLSFIGVFTLSLKATKLKRILIYFISFSAGALFGDAFLHLLPEAVERHGFGLEISLSVLFGVVVFFSLEKFVRWQHCHMPITKEHVHPFATMNLVGDGVHNFLDGVIIAASFLVSVPVGIATTIAVALHEIPQEIGDFGVLLHGGFSKSKALLLNFATALTALLGAGLVYVASSFVSTLEMYLVPVAVGGFIYIAGSDLIPELHNHEGVGKSLLQLLAFLIGIGIMAVLLILG